LEAEIKENRYHPNVYIPVGEKYSTFGFVSRYRIPMSAVLVDLIST
jgi:hypothetical protein